jgi:hypothetical protein
MEFDALQDYVDQRYGTIRVVRQPIQPGNQEAKRDLLNTILELLKGLDVGNQRLVKTLYKDFQQCLETAFTSNDLTCMQKLKRELESLRKRQEKQKGRRRTSTALYYAMIFVSHVTAYSFILTYSVHSEMVGGTVQLLVNMYSNFIKDHCHPSVTKAMMTIMTTVSWRTMKFTYDGGHLSFVPRNRYKGGLMKHIVTQFLASAIGLVYMMGKASFAGSKLLVALKKIGIDPEAVKSAGNRGSIEVFLTQVKGSDILGIVSKIEFALATVRYFNIPVAKIVQLVVRFGLVGSGKVVWYLVRLLANATMCLTGAKQSVGVSEESPCVRPAVVSSAVKKGLETPSGSGGVMPKQEIARGSKHITESVEHVTVCIYIVTRRQKNGTGISFQKMEPKKRTILVSTLANKAKRLIDQHQRPNIKVISTTGLEYQRINKEANIPAKYPAAYMHIGSSIYMDPLDWFSPASIKTTPIKTQNDWTGSPTTPRGTSRSTRVQNKIIAPVPNIYTIYVIGEKGDEQSSDIQGRTNVVNVVKNRVGIDSKYYVVHANVTQYQRRFKHKMARRGTQTPYVYVHTPKLAVIYLNPKQPDAEPFVLVPPRRVNRQGNVQQFVYSEASNENGSTQRSESGSNQPNQPNQPNQGSNWNGSVSNQSLSNAIGKHANRVKRQQRKILDVIKPQIIDKFASGNVYVRFSQSQKPGVIWADALGNLRKRVLPISMTGLRGLPEIETKISDAFGIQQTATGLAKHYVVVRVLRGNVRYIRTITEPGNIS